MYIRETFSEHILHDLGSYCNAPASNISEQLTTQKILQHLAIITLMHKTTCKH